MPTIEKLEGWRKRRRDIASMVKDGSPRKDVAKFYGISVERVRQICAKEEEMASWTKSR